MARKKSLSHRDRRPPRGFGGPRWRSPAAGTGPVANHGTWHVGARVTWLPTLLNKGPQPLQAAHLRRAMAPARAARLHLVVLDTSGSMRSQGRLARAKGHAAWLIERAARAGDDAALLTFGGQGTTLQLPPGPARASDLALIRPLGGGGGTPLADALAQSDALLRRAARRRGPCEAWLWLLTDGRTLEQPTPPRQAQHIVLIDFDDPARPLGRCATWAASWGAEHRSAS